MEENNQLQASGKRSFPFNSDQTSDSEWTSYSDWTSPSNWALTSYGAPRSHSELLLPQPISRSPPRKRQYTPELFSPSHRQSANTYHVDHCSQTFNMDFDRAQYSASPSPFLTESMPTSPWTGAYTPILIADEQDQGSPVHSTISSITDVSLDHNLLIPKPNAASEGEEDEDVNSDSEPEVPIIRCDDVCIGMILSQPIILNLGCQSSSSSTHAAVPVSIGSKHAHQTLPICILARNSSDAEALGFLDKRTSQVIEGLLDRDLVRLHAWVDYRNHKNPKTGAIAVCINLYANNEVVETLGEFFQKNHLYLQHPFMPVQDIPYNNPHFLTKPGETLTTTMICRQYTDSQQTQIDAENNDTLKLVQTLNTKSDFEKLLDTIGHNFHTLEKIAQHPDIKTILLPHQLEALSFMTFRERPRQFNFTDGVSSCRVWKRESTHQQNSYHNIITGDSQMCSPGESLGGLLADHMGLGKTLSILSLIVHSLPEMAKNDSDEGITTSKVKTTLVVTKKSVLPQWEQQARQHIKPGRLRTLTYYGGNRESNGSNEIAQCDVVFTTYDTVTQEWIKNEKQPVGATPQGTLHTVSWFRIVLDEGHEIRNWTTHKAKAINALSAERRWCVTGTPIQNSLKDLAAIFQFLRLEPFHDYRILRNHVLNPLKRHDPAGVWKLRCLIEAITLRRVKGTVELPPRVSYTKEIELQPKERQLYNKQLQDSRYMLDNAIKSKDKVQASSALEVILRLRLICDHGADLLPRCDGSDDAQARELLIEDVAIESQAYTTGDEVSASAILSTYNPLSLYQDLYQDKPQQPIPKINIHYDCDIDGDVDMSSPTSQRFQHGRITSPTSTNSENHTKFPHYTGPSSKVQALIDVLKNPKNEWCHGNGPIKSVVFSVWTRMLDLVAIAFDTHHIKYCRLDGSMSTTARNASLKRFHSDPEITVILVSLMAGGVGLNLTVASQVHLLEPHWNPMIEEQALDRVHRIGQLNPVQVFRYLVKNSFENAVMKLQEKKLGLARLGMEKLTKEDLRLEKLKEIRALFT